MPANPEKGPVFGFWSHIAEVLVYRAGGVLKKNRPRAFGFTFDCFTSISAHLAPLMQNKSAFQLCGRYQFVHEAISTQQENERLELCANAIIHIDSKLISCSTFHLLYNYFFLRLPMGIFFFIVLCI